MKLRLGRKIDKNLEEFINLYALLYSFDKIEDAVIDMLLNYRLVWFEDMMFYKKGRISSDKQKVFEKIIKHCEDNIYPPF